MSEYKISAELEQAFRPGWFLEHYQHYYPLYKASISLGGSHESDINLPVAEEDTNIQLEWNGKDGCWNILSHSGEEQIYLNESQDDELKKIMVGDRLRVSATELTLIHCSGTEKLTHKNISVVSGVSSKLKIERAIDWLLDEGVCSCAHLADALKIERTTLSRHVSLQFGTTPIKLIRDRRMNRAAVLLRNKKLKPNIIAKKCGFKNISHFSRSFKTYFGAPPSQYVC